MTSDLIQNKYVLKPHKSLHLELTRDEDFLSGRYDIFDVLARHSAEKEGWDRSMNGALALLERAKVMLNTAESTITQQTHRIQNLEVHAETCPVTGLLNRRGFTKLFVKEIARMNRGFNHGGLLVIFNLENLSKIQEQYGEDASHQAARIVANALENEIRAMDTAARIQDDEFVLLFAETSMDKALSRLQHMALRLNRLSFEARDKSVRISLSLGLKSYRRGEQAEQIFSDASQDLARNRKESSSLKRA